MIGCYEPSRLITEPGRDTYTLREYIDYEIRAQARMLTAKLDGVEEIDDDKDWLKYRPTYELLAAMPVKVIVHTSNMKCSSYVDNWLPLIMEDMLGKLAVDPEYSFTGTYMGWLIHISAPEYGWLGDVSIKDCELHPEIGTIVYDNYDWNGGN